MMMRCPGTVRRCVQNKQADSRSKSFNPGGVRESLGQQRLEEICRQHCCRRQPRARGIVSANHIREDSTGQPHVAQEVLMASSRAILRLPVGNCEVALDFLDRKLSEDRAMDHEPVFEPARALPPNFRPARTRSPRPSTVTGSPAPRSDSASHSRTKRCARRPFLAPAPRDRAGSPTSIAHLVPPQPCRRRWNGAGSGRRRPGRLRAGRPP